MAESGFVPDQDGFVPDDASSGFVPDPQGSPALRSIGEALTAPKRYARAAGVGIERAITDRPEGAPTSLGQIAFSAFDNPVVAERAKAAAQPGYVAPEGEQLGAGAGEMAAALGETALLGMAGPVGGVGGEGMTLGRAALARGAQDAAVFGAQSGIDTVAERMARSGELPSPIEELKGTAKGAAFGAAMGVAGTAPALAAGRLPPMLDRALSDALQARIVGAGAMGAVGGMAAILEGGSKQDVAKNSLIGAAMGLLQNENIDARHREAALATNRAEVVEAMVKSGMDPKQADFEAKVAQQKMLAEHGQASRAIMASPEFAKAQESLAAHFMATEPGLNPEEAMIRAHQNLSQGFANGEITVASLGRFGSMKMEPAEPTTDIVPAAQEPAGASELTAPPPGLPPAEVAPGKPVPNAPIPNLGDRLAVKYGDGQLFGQVVSYDHQTGEPVIKIEHTANLNENIDPGDHAVVAHGEFTIIPPALPEPSAEAVKAAPDIGPAGHLGDMTPDEFKKRFPGVDDKIYHDAMVQHMEATGYPPPKAAFEKFPDLVEKADEIHQEQQIRADRDDRGSLTPIGDAVRALGGIQPNRGDGGKTEDYGDMRAQDLTRHGFFNKNSTTKGFDIMAQMLKNQHLLPEDADGETLKEALRQEIFTKTHGPSQVNDAPPTYEEQYPSEFKPPEPAEAWPPERLNASLKNAGLKKGDSITSKGFLDPGAGRVAAGKTGKIVAIDLEHGKLLVEFKGKTVLADPRDLRETSKADKWVGHHLDYEPGTGVATAGETGGSVKTNTGQTDRSKIHQLTEAALLRVKMANQQLGSIVGARAAQRQTESEMMELMKQGKDIRQEITLYARESFRGLKANSVQMGQIVKMAANAKGPEDLLRAMEFLQETSAAVYHKALWGEIKKILNRSIGAPGVELGQQRMMIDLVKNIDVFGENVKGADRQALRAEYLAHIQAHQADAEISTSFLDELMKGSRRSVGAISEAESERLRDTLMALEGLGRLEQKAKEFAEAFATGHLANALISSARPLSEKPITERKTYGSSLGAMTQVKNYINQSMNWFANLGRATWTMTHAFRALDGGRDGGHVHEVDRAFTKIMGEFFDRRDPLRKQIEEAATRLKIGRAESERIHTFLMLGQEGGLEHFLEDPRYGKDVKERIATVKSIKLTPAEMEMAKILTDITDEPGSFERIAELQRRLSNRELVKSKMVRPDAKWFPFEVAYKSKKDSKWLDVDDMEVAGVLADMMDHKRFARTNVERGFTVERNGESGAALNNDAIGTALRFIDKRSYFEAAAEFLHRLGTVVNLPQYRQAVGPVGHQIMMDFTDLAVRAGRADGARKIRWMDTLRADVSKAKIGGRLSSALVHVSALFPAMGEIGTTNGMLGFERALFNKEWSAFAEKASPILRNRRRSEFAYEGERALIKAGNKSLQGLIYLTNKTAMGAWIGSYQKSLDDRGLKPDFKKPDATAVAYADDMVARTQPSHEFYQMCLLLSNGSSIGNKSLADAIFQFENPMMSRFSYFYHDVWKHSGPGRRGEAFKRGVYVAMGLMAEVGVRHASKAIIALLAGLVGYDLKNKHGYLEDLYMHIPMSIPIVNKAFQAGLYKKAPIPIADEMVKIFAGAGDAIAAARAGHSLKAAAATTESLMGLAAMAGIPYTGQAGDIVRGMLKDADGPSRPHPQRAHRTRPGR